MSPPPAQPTSIRSVYRPSPFGDRPFHWIETGRGEETILFLHGIMAHSMAFRFVLDKYTADYRVVAPDLPAHGRDRTFEHASITADLKGLLHWLEALIDTLEGRPVHIVGHSLGATLTYLAALAEDSFPNLKSITLVSPGLKIRVPRWTSRLLNKIPPHLTRLGIHSAGIRLYEPFQWRKARMTAEEIADYLTPIQDPRRIGHMLQLGADLVRHQHQLEEARKILQPTLLIWGDRDLLLPLPTAYELSHRIPDARLQVFKNCGHCPMEDYPEIFQSTLRDFLLQRP